ncbi:hypothetical protein E2562_026597 [Oryza meyeriana var. granulata]|uniref:Uncharacterized protein n=1 Tax=Oryza meyeriana var. granulata TaxID=110450 RepID=A0A6G1CTB9_9ORYZ|nr:hypothetical protein E2562_026597 [Oryza meyeriana var. granulata]
MSQARSIVAVGECSKPPLRQCRAGKGVNGLQMPSIGCVGSIWSVALTATNDVRAVRLIQCHLAFVIETLAEESIGNSGGPDH